MCTIDREFKDISKGRFEWVEKKLSTDVKDYIGTSNYQVKKKTGIHPDEMLTLYKSLAIAILPRLMAHRYRTIGYPAKVNSIKRWHNILDKMIWSFQRVVDGDDMKSEFANHPIFEVRLQKGFVLFGKYFSCLWD